MVQMTMQVSDSLAERIKPISGWLPTIIELSLVGFKTMATVTASEIIEFLLENPTPQEVLNYHISAERQARLQRLLALNELGILSEAEQSELDELEQLEHIIIMLKTGIAAQTT